MANKHADWWAEWWKRDYSWEGLGEYLPDGAPKHPWEGWITDGPGNVREDDGENDVDFYLENARNETWPRIATLQDYWRDQEDELIPDPNCPKDERGKHTRHFTRFHLPLNWEDGSATEKTGWSEANTGNLKRLIGEKLGQSSDTEFDYFRGVQGPDRRVQFQGGVFLDFKASDFITPPTESGAEPPTSLLNWRSDFAYFSGDARFNGATFSGDAWFESATFSRDAQFNSATFSGDAWFESATFSVNADFYSATFSGDAEFESTTFSGSTWFKSATFSGGARFYSATFSGDVGFESATFSGDAGFYSATFSGDAGFQSATFSEDARFERATFSGEAWFYRPTFCGDAWFNSATFFGEAWFYRPTFCGDAWFNSATFSGDALFNSAIFAGKVSFQGDGASFTIEPFELRSQAGDAADRPDAGKEGGFPDSFARKSGFNDLAKRAFKNASFEDCVFLDDLNFNNRDFTEATSFRRSEFWRLVSFHGSRLHQGVSFYNAIFRYAVHRDRQCKRCGPDTGGRDWPQVRDDVKKRLYEADMKAGKTEADLENWAIRFEEWRTRAAKKFERLPKSKYDARENEGFLKKLGLQFLNLIRLKKHNPQPVEGDTQEDYFEKLEACYRTLRLAMEDKRDRVEEGKFFSLEIKTRRRRRRPNVPFWERFMSDLYGGTSDYGNSIIRPVVWIFILMCVFGLIYLALGSWYWNSLNPLRWQFGFPTGAEFWQAMNYSAGRVLGFGPWEREPQACTMMGNLLNISGDEGTDCGRGARTAFGVRLVASLQTLSAIILVFLSGLAVRRRFQIN